MKFLFPVLALMMFAGCSDLYRHERDFSPKHRKGPWVEYRQAVIHGQTPEAPKELKDR